MHGFAGSARNLRPQARFLAQRHRVVLFDARGHARSPAPPSDADYTLSKLVEDVHRLVMIEEAHGVVLGGISLGAAVALQYALVHPRTLRGLVLASFPPARDASRWASTLADAIEQRGLEQAGEELVWGGGRFDAEAAKWIRQGFLEHSPRALVATLRGALANRPDPSEHADALGELLVPTLLIVGERDAPAVGASRELARLIPGARLAVIAAAGHVTNLEKPEEFNRLLDGFLSEIEAR
jgi:pimeloyl-ACP methyl ester carboxylesterase